MIYIGVTGWGDHHTLYPPTIKTNEKLEEYSSHFPIVELDSSFYAVQPIKNMEKWVRETPASFQFVVKAYQGMTGHQRGDSPYSTKTDMFAAFTASLQPLIDANKLAMVLFQFPPWFDCKDEHILYLNYCKQKMKEIPIALEFRNRTWFNQANYNNTLIYLNANNWNHTIVDEPQVGDGSIPTVLVPTKPATLIRLHGRNIHGWNRPKNTETSWREVRYLYHYNKTELEQWRDHIQALHKQCKKIYVLFNNNSGGDAAENAKTLQTMLEIEYNDLGDQQLRLF
ncbi:Uncharacterized conserved protein YecE, DUF72 family [Amphibacillus marinus]|uniref:Uncharacterized conserved protein YecE, DUF72 family n=1 Tax=Amphibacillus marinus TaxID=872970 RepID=A0A1H8LSP0_9BACI|nr:DUF72 domain-containing protein [Amphibacillus marinus]SEO07868.1 Uncharacterized conserved protein YecE, DUF72 family [Amphibacillus marinus]